MEYLSTTVFTPLESIPIGRNASIKDYNLEDLKMDSNFVWLLCSLISAISWLMYITYYNSRVAGYIITRACNRFYIRDGYFKIGSVTLNVLSGKIMFRDIAYITHDYSARVQDGYLIFRWWRSYVPKDVSEDLSHSDTRLSIVLNGLELHVYNRSDIYSHLEKVFGLDASMYMNEENPVSNREEALNDENAGGDRNNSGIARQRSEAAMARTWRDLIPVIKMDVSSGRLVFGNRLIPTTLSVTVEECHFVYSTKPPASTMDKLMHFTKCWAENARVMLAPSPKYTGMLDEPPRYMGEGFVLMSSNYVELYMYMDEPGVVPEEPVLVRLANGDVVESSPPMWGVDIKCGKGTDFSYGPWADRQREHLFKFFFPNDYQSMKVTKTPRPGDKRQMQTFDIRLSMLNEATIDVLFSKNKETNAVHVNVGAGSYLEVTLPWITLQDGYTTTVNGQLLHLEATTSLQYRHLVSSETLEFSVNCRYPIVWNHHQQWELSLTGCKATVHLVYAHKTFFSDLVNDWSSKHRPDVMHFVPYTWRFGLTLKHCELITLSNEYNWVDCSSVGRNHLLENTQLALCAHLFHLSFELPFDQFLPDINTLNFQIQGESIDLSLYIPETHTSRNIVLALEKYARVLSKEGSLRHRTENIPKWRSICQRSDGWVDFWWVPIGAINIQWLYHPSPPLGPQPQADISTPVKEELLLSPMRFPHGRNKPTRRSPDNGGRKFDPTSLSSDRVTVELEIGPSVLLLFGTALRNFLHLKENVFGDDQMYTDMQSSRSGQQTERTSSERQTGDSSGVHDGTSVSGLPPEMQEDFDHRNYRPLEVDVSIIMHDIQAHLLKNCTSNDPPCPVVLLERFGFEMKKRYEQTELQLLLSPSVLLVSDNVNRTAGDRQLSQGRMTLSSLQVRGHAMFSDTDRALDEDTLEYAWLVEIQLGRLSGKITTPQLHQLVTSLETLVLLASDPENELLSPLCLPSVTTPPSQPETQSKPPEPAHNTVNNALHTLLQPRQGPDRRSVSQATPPANQGVGEGGAENSRQIPSRQTSRSEPATGEGVTQATLPAHKLKYKFCRAAIDVIDVWLVESGTALQLWISPVRVASCNLHGKRVGSGLSCVLYNAMLRQLTCQTRCQTTSNDLWLEVGSVSLGTLIVESVMSLSTPEQHIPDVQDTFLRLHDARTRRLWFLWPDVTRGGTGRCGCTGGCSFFGNNRNGPRFFKPTPTDLSDGINVASFKINDPSKDPGYGQSILHDNQLIFRTPPYTATEICLQDPPVVQSVNNSRRRSDTTHDDPYSHVSCTSPATITAEHKGRVSRRFSYTLTRNHANKEGVPYSRLVDGPVLPAKLDSDSKLHTEKSKSILDVPDTEQGPKNSVSDSKLAVDYFNTVPVSGDTVLVSEGQVKADVVTGKSVNVSESHHSLSARLDNEERLRREVQRTTSMSSENQSEAFFSADEEMNPSRTSSLRHSIIGSGNVLSQDVNVQRKKFASDLSIVTDRTGIPTVDTSSGSGPNSLPEGVRSRLSSHRSDHEIHTPEHRSLGSFRRPGSHQNSERHTTSRASDSPRLIERGEQITCDSSDSRSLSSNSYVSAVCSQEDMTLVDLHMQVNRQILDSPLLMSSYVSHLSQTRCPNWQQNIPAQSQPACLFQQLENKLLYIGGLFVPRMDIVSEGVTLLRLANRRVVGEAGNTPDKDRTWDGKGVADLNATPTEIESTAQEEDELLISQNEAGSRTAVIVKLQGQLDITITPLLLESLQRFVDAVIPTMINLHPLTVVNHLHSNCVSQVVSANMLKRDQGGIWRLDQSPQSLTAELQQSGAYEECVRTQIQAAIVLPKVNITLLQASVVEEIISFSALDNIKDLTCVSLFAVCFDNVTARFHSGKQAREVVQIFHRPTVTGQPGGKKGAIPKGPMAFLMSHQNAAHSDTITGEPVYIETSEKQQEETVVSLNIGRVHAQLRRLTNDSSILDDAVITAIPGQHSKVLFTCTRVGSDACVRPVDYYFIPENLHLTTRASEQYNTEDKLGFIMFECGLEGVSIKVVKRSQFEKLDNGNEDKLTCKTDSDIYICTDSVKSRDDIDSVEKSETSTQTTVTSQVKTQTAQNSVQNQVKSQPQVSQTQNGGNPPPIKEEAGVMVNKDTGSNGNISSCVIDLKTVWFNFAAPPRAPITRKLDYTRLDWNLLSTASPAINAWMNPSNRLAIRVVHMFRTMYRRSTGAVACLMAEALDVQAIHMPVKSRFGRLTPLSKTLQEDPSCQLCTVLEKYVLQSDIQAIEANLREGDLPQLSTLRQGVIVLSRQWKNVLYTPLLLEHNYKSKYVRPLNVTFTVPDLDEMCLTDGEASGNDEQDVTDECAMLLRTGALLKPVHGAHKGVPGKGGDPVAPVNSPRVPVVADNVMLPQPQVAVIAEGIESVLTSPSPPSVPHRRLKKGLQPTQIPSSSRASVVFPILNPGNPFIRRPQGDESIGYGTLQEDNHPHQTSPSQNTHSSPSLPSPPPHASSPPHGGSLPANATTTQASGALGARSTSGEDLYSWMAKQQEYVRGLGGEYVRGEVQRVGLKDQSRGDTLGTDSSGGEVAQTGVSLYPMRDSLRLLDAHLIFQPLLSSLGVMPHQMVPSAGTGTTGLDSLGSNLSLVGSMDQMRIDIVVSEHGKSDKRRATNKAAKSGRLRVDCSDECPAFVCERVSVELELEKMADMTVDDMIRTRNVLYISRGQLKKHTSTALNFSIAVRYISQQVNMPLLRLLHQISNMYQNVKDTQNELREQQPTEVRRFVNPDENAEILKNHSSSASDLQEITIMDGHNKPLSLKVSDPSSILSQNQKPVISPSASVRSRPQSFAQKLRSTGKSVKGYMNLSEGVGTPLYASSPTASALERMTVSAGSEKSATIGQCWKTVYHLLDLYATMPETKTITHRFSVAADISEHYKASKNNKYDLLPEAKSSEEFAEKTTEIPLNSTPVPPQIGANVISGERTRLVVFGVARIHRTRLLATLSGLKLEAEITSLHSSLTWRKKSRPATLEFSLTGQVGRTMIVLLEGVAPNQQTVVRVTVGKSQALYSSVSKRGKDKNSGLLTVGAVNVDIPQHPVALHGMVTRGSKQLSSTLQELRVTRTASRVSRQDTVIGMAEDVDQYSPSHKGKQNGVNGVQNKHEHTSGATLGVSNTHTETGRPLLQPLVMQFSVILQSLGITAALLPSLQAQYKMDQVNSTGVTGSRAKFTIDLPQHSLSFTTKLQATEANLPSEACISLPAVHVSAEYVPEGAVPAAGALKGGPVGAAEGLVLRQGGYLAANADIGVFEHSLTTDLLNHLVFVQKVFMKEVNEVVQKVYGGERPVPLWLEDTDDSTSSVWSRILFTLVIRIQRIQLTATTAGSSAVRLETGAVALELSNRVQGPPPEMVRLFGKAQVDVNLSLGQLTRNPMFEEAEPDFQQFAFFNTRIGLRNAFQDEMVDEGESNKEVVLITLKRPLVYVQPLAVDKAILVWLNYKNAYDYWNEKRANLNKEVLTATQQVFEKVPFGQLTSQLSAPINLGTLFLQLTVDDMGICLPLNPLPLTCHWGQPRSGYDDARGAVVVTLESTSIAACSSGSLVSKGRFANLCLRFADDFDPSLDDWKPDMTDTNIVNLCVVSEGTYEVCSRTIAAKQPNENAKWFLNVQWQMEGVDMNVDVSVGKQLSALGHTLTMLTGSEDGPNRSGSNADTDSDDQDIVDGSRASQDSIIQRGTNSRHSDNLLPAFVFDTTLDSRKRSKLIEKEMNEQAKIINDLRSLGASHNTIEQEMRRLHELEAMVFKDFRRDMIQKLRRQSVKASSIKGKLGLGSKSSAYRSRSFIVPSPTPERRPGMDNIDNIDSPEDQQIDQASMQGRTSAASVSYESSPRSGPSRTASLRVKSSQTGPRVTFRDGQASTFGLAPKESSLDLGLSSDWTDQNYIIVDGQRVELRPRGRNNTDDSEADIVLTPSPASTLPPTSLGSQQPPAPNKSQEPNIDFELDVKVLINSGKCVLHTKDPSCNDDHNHQGVSGTSLGSKGAPSTSGAPPKPLRKDRSCSAGLLDFGAAQQGSSAGSPDTARRNREKGAQSGAPGQTRYQQTRTQAHQNLANQLIDLTIFRIPGMDVKVHYESKVISQDDEPIPQQKESVNGTPEGSEPSSERTERARTTDSEEDSDGLSLLEQEDFRMGFCNPNYGAPSTRTPPPLQLHNRRPTNIKKASLFAWMTLQSIPEETIISPHILEFLEQTLEPIPASKQTQSNVSTVFNNTDASMDPNSTYNYVYTTSFPVDVIVYFHMQPSTFRFSCLPVSRVECMLQLPSLDIVFSSKRADEEGEVFSSEFGPIGSINTAVGGLSVTGCLADFSVYIFHPYGGGKKSGGSGGLKEAPQWSPLADSERKDSLSINVEFVKFHLSRSRKLNFQQDSSTAIMSGGRSPASGADQSRAVIRFSTIVDIGSASFKYDMRRLTEILAFPKAWYRRSIVRRLFLGDLSLGGNQSTGSYSTHEESVEIQTETEPSTSLLSRSAPTSGDGRSPLLTTRDKLRLSLEGGISRHAHSDTSFGLGDTSNCSTPLSDGKNLGGAWETLVLFAVNFTRLNVHMNMGNVMGNVTWQSKDFRSEGRLGIGSTGHKNMYIGVGLGGSALDAKGGIVGGTIELANIDTYIRIREEPYAENAAPEPDHTVGARLQALELRLDYMGTSVLMCRVSALDVTLRDEWRLGRTHHTATRRPATIFVHGVLGWEQLQCLISKSSTADLIKMYHKLEEFFSQQFNSSKRVFSRLGPPQPGVNTKAGGKVSNAGPAPARHHRHWQRVLKQTAGLRLCTLARQFSLPEAGTVLGGTMELHGQNVSLACFHGINFKSKSWALFSLREPSVSFNTEAQEIPSANGGNRGPHDVHVVQTLTCSLGLSTYKTHHSMATVCKVSRSVMFPPQFKSLHEWFHYAFASSQIDEVDKFPSLERERLDGTGNNSLERTRAKLIDPNHTREVIFALPSLQLHLKTEHLQTADTPSSETEDSRPTVDCSFITEFEDHIFVTVDAEAFFFLHDLITSYLKEKDRVAYSSQNSTGRANSPDTSRASTSHSTSEEDKKKRTFDPEDMFSKDWRHYRCKTWHLEPTVRLLSWAGKSIEPYGIDYILQKLGFSHARTTIPKWMQRGFMDPLDKVLAVLTLRMVAAVKDGNGKYQGKERTN